MNTVTYEKHLREASRTFKIADHMLAVTYPLVKDAKLLLAILDNLFLSIDNSMTALLNYDRIYKKIPPFQEEFNSKFNMFRIKSAQMYKIDKKQIELVQEIKEMIEKHKESPVEFTRKDQFVICTDNFSIKTLSTKDIKEYILKTKEFNQTIENIIGENSKK